MISFPRRPDDMELVSYTAPTHETPAEIERECVGRLLAFLRDKVINSPNGQRRPPRGIAARLIVLQSLLDPHQSSSFAAEARSFGLSRERFRQFTAEFADCAGLHPIASNGRKSVKIAHAARLNHPHS